MAKYYKCYKLLVTQIILLTIVKYQLLTKFELYSLYQLKFGHSWSFITSPGNGNLL